MKARYLVIALFALLPVVTPPVGQTSAADKMPFNATERFDPFGLFGPAVGTILDPGTVQCPGFVPTGDPMQPCPPGSGIHIRGLVTVSRVVAEDSGLSGWMRVEQNANWDAAGTGPAWGTFSLVLDAGGMWDGTWQGVRAQEGNVWVLPLHVVGHGSGGMIDGMQMKATDLIVGHTPIPIAYTGTIRGRFLDPRSK